MTGLEKILSEIRRSSDESVKERLDSANLKAKEIEDEAKAEAEKEVSLIKEKTEKAEKDILSRAKSSGELAVRKSLLLRKHKIIEEIIEDAKNKIENLPDDEYFEFLEKLLKKYAHNEKGIILMDKKDKERITDSFSKIIEQKGLSLSDKDLEDKGGFVLVYGDIEERCTVDALIDGKRDALTDIVMKAVFE